MNAPAKPEALRLFIALPLPERVLKAAQRLQTSLRARYRDVDSPMRWTAPENLHLTLHFLGNTPRTRVPELVLMLEEIAATTPLLELTLRALDGFPGPELSRLMFWEFTDNADLQALYQKLGSRLQTMGFTPENRPYRPHLTLVRFKQPQALVSLPGLSPLSFEATRLMLYQSELHPEGSRYQALSQALFRSQYALA